MAGRKRRYKNYLFDDEAEVPKRTKQYYDSEQRDAKKNGRDQLADRPYENNVVGDLEGHNNDVMSEDEQEAPRDFERLDEAQELLLEILATEEAEETEAKSGNESEHDDSKNNEANDLRLQSQERGDYEIILDPDLNYEEAVVNQNESQEGSIYMESDDGSDLEQISDTSDTQIILTTDQHHEELTEGGETFAESSSEIVLEGVQQDEDVNNQGEGLEFSRASSNRLCMGNKPSVLREELQGPEAPNAFEIPNNDAFELNEELQPLVVDEEEPLNIDIYDDETNEEQQGVSEEESLDHETNNGTNEEEHGMEQPHPTQPTHLKLRQELLKEKFTTPIMTPVTASPAETLLMTLAMAEKNNSTFKAFVDSVRLINSLFSCPVIPNSAYLLDKLLNAAEGFTKYFYCSKCCFEFGIRDSSVQPVIECTECGHSNDISNLAKSSFFVLYSIAPQIELMLMDKKIRENLSFPKELVQKNLSGGMKDLYDGKCYKSFVASLSETLEHVISLTVSTDGSPVFRLSSNFSIWPFLVKINELPPLIRMKNIMLAGLWFGNKKPQMDLFLEPLVDDLQKLEAGFKILFNEEEIIMHAYVIACCVDSGARGAVQGLNTHSGYFSCNWCEIPGEHVDKVVFPFPEDPPRKRTQASVVQHATECINDNKLAYVFGVQYLSPLVKWSKFNIVEGMVLDYAHNASFGISRTFLVEWLENTKRGSYIGAPDDLKELNRKLLSLTPPLEIRRPVRKMTDHANWNAREFENWTSVFSIIVLTGIFPAKYLNNYVCLVQGMFLVSRQGVTLEHINIAQKLFLHFLRDVEVLYGKSFMSYNCHILGLHMAENVLRWGPAWAISTLCFENVIKILKGLIHTQKGVPHQINRSLSYKQAIHLLKTTLESEKFETFESLLASKPNKQTKYFPVSDCVLTGNFSSFSPTREENYLIQRSGLNINVSESSVFNRMIAGRCVYTTDQAAVSKKYNNSCATTINGKLVIIQKIVLDKASEEVFIFCVEVLAETFLRLPQGVRLAPADHCLRIVTSVGTRLMLLSVKTLKIVNVFISLDGKTYVGEFPNIYNVF